MRFEYDKLTKPEKLELVSSSAKPVNPSSSDNSNNPQETAKDKAQSVLKKKMLQLETTCVKMMTLIEGNLFLDFNPINVFRFISAL